MTTLPSHDEIRAYLRIAKDLSSLSHARRAKNGAILVRDGRILSSGVNNTPKGWPDDKCEDDDLVATYSHVEHAEFIAINRLRNTHETSSGADLFCTTSPCIHCAIQIVSADIRRVFYIDKYRLTDGLDYLTLNKIPHQAFCLGDEED